KKLESLLQAEGRAIQKLLTRGSSMSIMELLDRFSMEELGDKLEIVAPMLWQILETTAAPSRSTQKWLVHLWVPHSKWEQWLTCLQVFTTACVMLSISRLQIANNYQVVIGLFLLGSGASKHKIELLAHAGLSMLYTAIRVAHLSTLSKDAGAKFRKLVKEQMFSIIWDNLNITF
ncbi:hypothetical protein B0H14DRAFT_2199825, partial [Mycena olivaceomarginata]